jgi:hypothetical protein
MRPRIDHVIPFEVAHFVEYLDPVALFVANVHQAIVIEYHAMDNLEEGSADTGLGFSRRSLAAPLPDKMAGLIEHGNAAVAITVGNIDIAVGRIDRDTRRPEKACVTRILEFKALPAAVLSELSMTPFVPI